MKAKFIALIFACSLFGTANASLDDFVEVDEESTAELNAEIGVEVTSVK